MKNAYFTALTCIHCGESYPPDRDLLLCPACDNLLEAQYDYDRLRADWSSLEIERRPNNIWRWRELLPVLDFDRIVTLGEGGAPLLDCPEIAGELGVTKCYILNDAGQPTGSLKDRSIAVTATKAREFGYRVLSCDSTGNKAASTAAYAARAGLRSVVFCPAGTPRPKLSQTLFYGAELVRVEGHYSEINAMYRAMVAERKYPWYDCGTDNPFRYEGKKTYAYEIAAGLGWTAPDLLLQPAAGGMSIVKAWKGFRELQALGLLEGDKLPRLAACQAANCGPIADALRAGLDHVPGVEKGPTVASAIAVSNPALLGQETLRAVQASGGLGVGVDDAALLRTWQRLARAGVFCEPSSAIAVASAYQLADEGRLSGDDVLVCVVTGSGFKDAETLDAQVTIPDEVVKGQTAFDARLEEIDRRFGC